MMTPENLPPARHRVRSAAAAPPNPAPEAPADDYAVGYRKPPLKTRFKPGQSGNPRGRPKGAKNLDAVILDVMNEKVMVNTASGRRRVRRLEVTLLKLAEQAGKGNVRAITALLSHYAQAQGAQASIGDVHTQSVEDATEADAQSLAQLRAIFLAEAAAAAKDDSDMGDPS